MPEPACQKITFAQMRAAGVRGVPSVLRVRGQKSCAKATITEIYATLPREVEVGGAHRCRPIKRLMRRTADDLIEIGNALIRQKAQLPHGAFHKWIEAESEMSIRTARRCMNVASEFGAKYAVAAHLGVMALDMLASAEPEVQAELERRIAAGDILSAADVNCIAVH